MNSNEPSSEFREELREYLREIGVIKNTIAGSFMGAFSQTSQRKQNGKRLYVFLKENTKKSYY